MEPQSLNKTENVSSDNLTNGKPFVPYEEIQEKKTTKFGAILLFIMVILGLWQGQGFIYSLSGNIPEPQSLSYCSNFLKTLVDSNNKTSTQNYNNFYGGGNYYYGYNDRNIKNCIYSEIETKYSIKNITEEISPLVDKLAVLQSELQSLNQSLSSAVSIINNEKQNYTISLQEKMAQENNFVFDKGQIKSSLTQAQNEQVNIQNQISKKQAEIDGVSSSITNIAIKNSTAINNVFDDYKSQVKLVQFERALLLLLLISPALAFTVRRYFRYKKENSQYTIIWAAVTTIFALLFAQVFFRFIYEILPRELIAKLIEFFAQFSFLVTILQYVLLFLTPVIFGGIVYWIQKRVYNKEAVMIRSLKTHKCPSCTMSLRESDRYCPVCHYQIKDKCSCGADRIIGLSFCPNCGAKK